MGAYLDNWALVTYYRLYTLHHQHEFRTEYEYEDGQLGSADKDKIQSPNRH